MSAETAILAELRAVHNRLDTLGRQLDVLMADRMIWPDLLTTSQARVYARVSSSTLYDWLRLGRLTDHAHPRRWERAELDRCLAGFSPARHHFDLEGRRDG